MANFLPRDMDTTTFRPSSALSSPLAAVADTLNATLDAPFDVPTQIDTSRRLWERVVTEAEALAIAEPLLARRLNTRVTSWPTAEQIVAAVLASRMASPELAEAELRALFAAEFDDPALFAACTRDLAAVVTRDPGTSSPLYAVLNLKGFHALQLHRVCHKLWQAGRRGLALTLANDGSLRFGVDIHPAAIVGDGVMLDHATGIVIGETAHVGNDVSILQGVTLGGTGKETGNRHPKVRDGVLLGAGAKVLGNIEIGAYAKVAAGSVVLTAVPPHSTVAGVPARIVRRLAEATVPAVDMCQAI